MQIQRLKEAWTLPSSTGVFTALQTHDVPWRDSNIDTLLNIQYHNGRSGNRIISPLVESYTDNTDELSLNDKNEIGSLLFEIYKDKWSKLYNLMELEYNPISNYDMTEEESTEVETENELTRTGTDTTQGTGTDAFTHTGTSTTADTGTETNQHTGTETHVIDEDTTGGSTGGTDTAVFGFNSSTGVDDTEVNTITTANGSRDETDTKTNNLTDTRTDNLQSQRTDNLTDTETRNITDTTTHNTKDTTEGSNSTSRTLTRSGNIGVTTSQQMIQSEIDLWKWNFFFQVFEDIDTVLTITAY